MNTVEARIRSVSDVDVCEAIRDAFPGKTDEEIIAELARIIVFVAVCWNDVIEGGDDAYEVMRRYIFTECDDLAGHFPWPAE